MDWQITLQILGTLRFIYEKIIIPIRGRIKWRGYSNRIRKFAITIDQFTITQKPQQPFWIPIIGKINRTEVKEIYEGWGSIIELFLVGNAGSGKTGIAWDLIEDLRKKKNLVLYLNAKNILQNQTFFEYLTLRIGKGKDFQDMVEVLVRESVLYVIIDHIDWIIEENQLSNFIDFLNYMKSLTQIRLLGIIRKFEWERAKDLRDLRYQSIYSRELSFEASKNFLENLNISSPKPELIKLSQNLLNLSLLGQLAKAGKNVSQISNQIELLDIYLDLLRNKEGDKIVEEATHLARKLLSSQKNIQVKFSKKSHRRLLSNNILMIDKFRNLIFRHEIIQEYFCVYDLLPETPTIKNIVDEFGDFIAIRLVSWLYAQYQQKSPKVEIKFTNEVLFGNYSFYLKGTLLDTIRLLQNPSKELVDIIVVFLSNSKQTFHKYFFETLNNEIWVKLLFQRKFFINVPEPIEDPNNPGYFGTPTWWAGEYLKRMAAQFPEIVRDVGLELTTDNARAIKTMLDAILIIPPEFAEQTVDSFERWAKTTFVHSMMIVYEMGLVMDFLSKGGQEKAALKILEVITEPFPLPDKFTEGKIVAGSRHDYFWLHKVLFEHLGTLIEVTPIRVVEILEQRLIEAIDLEVHPEFSEEDFKNYSYWRLNIDPDIESNYGQDQKNLLVNVLIQGLFKACEQEKEEVEDILSRYLINENAIFRRVAVHILRNNGDQYKELVEKAYRINREEASLSNQSEFERFLEAQYPHFPEEIQREIIGEIFVKKDDPNFQELMENRINEFPDRFEGETKEEKRNSFIDETRFRELHHYAKYLEGEYKKVYLKWKNKYEEPEPPVEDGEITTWIGPESPITEEDFKEKSIKEVIQYLESFVPETDTFIRKPTRLGLARTFESDIQVRPEKYALSALLLKNEKLHFIYKAHFFSGLKNALKAKQTFSIDKIIELAEYIVKVEKDPFEQQEYARGLPAAKLSAASFIMEFLRTKEPYVETELLERIGALILKLLWEDDPFLDEEVDVTNPRQLDPRTMNTNLDAATRSLNSIRGQAMHALIFYGLYCERKRKVEQGEDTPPVLVPLVKDALEEKLDKSKDSSLAVHSVIGWYVSKLIYLDKEWTKENLSKIFPLSEEEDVLQYWLAAWSAYVRFSDVYKNVFPVLIPQYQLAVELLSFEKKADSFERIDENLATHILRAYLFDLIQIDSDDGLVTLFYEKASDEIRSHGIFWLSQVLETQKPDVNDKTWKKIWDLWQWRMEEAFSAENKTDYNDEILSFARLLKNTSLELDQTHSIIEQTLTFKTDSIDFERHLVIYYLAENSENHLGLAIRLLHKVVETTERGFLMTDVLTSIRKILDRVAEDGEAEDKEIAIQIINTFGERGDFQWRHWLARME